MRHDVAIRAQLAVDLLAKIRKGLRRGEAHVLHVRRRRRSHRPQASGLGHARAQQAQHEEDGVHAVLAIGALDDLEARLRAQQPVPGQGQHAAELRADALREPRPPVAVRDLHDEAGTLVQGASRLGSAEAQRHPVGSLPVPSRVFADGQQDLVRPTHALLLLVAELLPAAHQAGELLRGQRPTDVHPEVVRPDVERQLQDATHLRQRAQEELQHDLVHAPAGAQHGLHGHVDAPALAAELHADAIRVAARALPLLLFERGVEPLGDQALQRLPDGGQVQLRLQTLGDAEQQLCLGGKRLAQHRGGGGNLRSYVRTGRRPGPRVLRRMRLAPLEASGPQLLLPPGPQHGKQLLGDVALGRRPPVLFAEAIAAQRPRELRQEPEFHAAPLPEARLPLRFLERLPGRQVLLEHQVLDVLHAGDRDVADAGDGRCGVPHADADALQRHTLRLPVRQRLGQRQGELLASDLVVGLRDHRRGAEDWNPPLLALLPRKERPPVGQLHLVELDDDAKRRAEPRL